MFDSENKVYLCFGYRFTNKFFQHKMHLHKSTTVRCSDFETTMDNCQTIIFTDGANTINSYNIERIFIVYFKNA